MLHKVNIAHLAIDPSSNAPVIILKAEEGDEKVPIWIGLLEARSIVSALNDVTFDRPMTHDLFKNFMGLLDIHISRIDICDIKDQTYYAQIHFMAKDETFTMDARPSDAIAMAIRFKAPIYVDDSVIDKSKEAVDNAEALVKSEDGEKWAEYLKQLDPEDFGKYRV
ncbi:MAG: bifunctional nuclease family protein [Desulfobacterales bacterium]